ncbi:MAG: SDR family oxidoreductase [Leptospirillia bacterium]
MTSKTHSGGRLQGQVALVTGATGDIGLATCHALSAEGANVAVAVRTLHRAEALARELEKTYGTRPLAIEMDVTHPTAASNMSEKLLKNYRRIDLIVNNAGVMHMDQLLDADVEQFRDTITTNIAGPFLVARALINEMMQVRHGTIINIAAMAGLTGAPFLSAFCASKAALVSLTQSWGEELADNNIRVYALCPDVVDTASMRELMDLSSVDALTPEAVAARIVALACGDETHKSGSIVTMEVAAPGSGATSNAG